MPKSKTRSADWTKERFNEERAINQALLELIDRPPDDPQVQAIIKRHYSWVSKFLIPSKDTYRALARFYCESDYRDCYDAIEPKLADFLAQAMEVYASSMDD